ncbi:arf-GAP with Rho-GAP domain, ANK repeat and PH domain-containing protein 1 isoform X2 [Antennarius striatus]|uniref:arf-GAP with Rho-GAP domain, ANK repeat and PH domain-containing protein 1 isoform X2 n=1 Tax=Antennarius striatus TaxID=241820 RepID=UPI0035B3553E
MSQSESCATVCDWLCVLRLEQYSEAFLNAGLETLQKCRSLTPDQLEQMGITLPGHQRRILSSLNKTLCNSDSVTQRDQGLVETGHDSAIQIERPVPIPVDERVKGDGETLIPTPRERERPVPRGRQVSRMKEEGGDGGEKKPLSAQTPTVPGGRKEDGSYGGIEGERQRPVPKERTKFLCITPVDCHPNYPVTPHCDTALPPVPPRSTPNCPPQPFTSPLSPSAPDRISVSPKLHRHAPTVHSGCVSHNSTPTSTPAHIPTPSLSFAQTRPQTLPLQLDAQHLGSDGGRKASHISPIKSPKRDRNAPPLPPKVGALPKSPPPVPQRFTAQSPKSPSSSPGQTVSDEMQNDQSLRILPDLETSQQSTPPDSQPTTLLKIVSQPLRDSTYDVPSDCSDEYEDPGMLYQNVDQMNPLDRDVTPALSEQSKGQFVCTDDKLLDDEANSWQNGGLNSVSSATKEEDSSQLTAVIKMGWLDKHSPQGSHTYQRRWVKLDVDYLKYFDSDKDVYSKGFLSTAFITNVNNVGDVKFEVVTNQRTFTFRAENEVERNNWVTVLQDCTRGRQLSGTVTTGSLLTPGHQGYLEQKGLRSKYYTVVASDKVFLYKNIEHYRLGMGITSIDMNVGKVKDTDRRSFELITPYRVFSFIAESEQHRQQWVGAMQDAIGEALSNSEVADRMWAEPSNSFCADCGDPRPEWAAINLCVVICKQCAGEHRRLGPSISKVRSLKMDRKVWTEELIQVFLLLGNERANSFWAANVPPSEALTPSSYNEERRNFITNKYRQGKYRKYHQLYGNPRELNNALCINVQSSDVLETLSLIFCGADVNCSTGNAKGPSPLSLAKAHEQPLQAELISHNLNTELPRSEVDGTMEAVHYSAPPNVSHNGFLFKTASMSRAVSERKAREEFSRRWCTLNDGIFSYYDSDKNSNPNGVLKASEIVCLAVNTSEKHGYDHTFELYTQGERLYLFGTDDPDSHKEWVTSIAKSIIPINAEPLLRLAFDRIGRLKYKDGLNLQSFKAGWFALVGTKLHTYLADNQGEEIHLQKLIELSMRQNNEVLVLVEKGRTLYIEGERKLDFAGWCEAIKVAAGSGGNTLSEQQLTETDIPVIAHICFGYITQCGLTSEGIYRKSGVNSRITALCDKFRHDARSVFLREGEHQVDDVANALKRFFRDLEEGLFTAKDSRTWLTTAAITDESVKICQYQMLLNRLPRVNKATLQALINHLYCVQRFSDMNQMNLHNLAIVFGPTLFQTDGKDYNAGRAIEDLIQYYTTIFEVDEQQLKRQLEEITVIIRVREQLNTKIPSEPGGHFICTVYLEEKTETAEQHVKIPGSMTAAELCMEILDRRNIPFKEKEYWTCWEICDKEEMERPLHYQERVLPILHSFGTDSHLLIKKHVAMDAMMVYLASEKGDASKHGMMKFRSDRSILGLGLYSGGFQDRYFILNSSSLRMYKEIRSNRPERDWPVKSLSVYLGIKKRLRPPTCWGLTVLCECKKQEKVEKQQWYLCCETQAEMREWYATFLSIQYDGNVWPRQGLQQTRLFRDVR